MRRVIEVAESFEMDLKGGESSRSKFDEHRVADNDRDRLHGCHARVHLIRGGP